MLMSPNEVSGVIVDASIRIHKALGPGLLESAYHQVLMHDLTARGLRVRFKVPIPLKYESLEIDKAFEADLIVEEQVIVDIKSVETLRPIHSKQLLAYLKLTNLHLGLLLNFTPLT
jgi:GxxExxY protein